MKSSWRITVPRLPINSSTTPFQAINPASVTTNDGMPTLANRMPWKAPIAAPAASAATMRDHGRHLVAVGDQEDGDDHARHARHVADRQVDLAEQQHEDDAHGDRGVGRRLHDQVHEVRGREEAVVLRLEDDRDDDQPEDDRERAELARLDVGPPALRDVAQRGAPVRRSGSGRGAHAVTSATSTSSWPGTLESLPAVIAWTTSCWFVSVRLNSATFWPSRRTVIESATSNTS